MAHRVFRADRRALASALAADPQLLYSLYVSSGEDSEGYYCKGLSKGKIREADVKDSDWLSGTILRKDHL